MNIHHLFKRSFRPVISQLFIGIFVIMAWCSLTSCVDINKAANTGDLQKADELFNINDVMYHKPKGFEVSQSFSEMGGMTTYLAAQDSQILKIILTPEVAQTEIPFEITQIKFYGDDGKISTGSFSTESVADSKGPQTDIEIIGRSILQKDEKTMLYLSYSIYAPIDKMSKRVFVKYDGKDLFSLDIDESTVK
jgi:hypothetical protein